MLTLTLNCIYLGSQIADEMKPPRFIIPILIGLANIIPTWKIVPINDVIDLAHKNPEKRQEVITQFNSLMHFLPPLLITFN